MTQQHDPGHEPHWLRLAATRRVTPDPATLARVRARLAARSAEPAWVHWLARPAALALSAGLLVVSTVGGALLISDAVRTDAAANESATSMTSALLGDDGTYGLPVTDNDAAAGDTDADSGEVQR